MNVFLFDFLWEGRPFYDDLFYSKQPHFILNKLYENLQNVIANEF